MEISTLLLVAFICVTIGYIAGALITTLRGDREEAALRAQIAELTGEGGATRAPASPSEAGQDGSPVANLWRDPSTGMLRADIGGETIKSGRDLTTEQRHKVLEVVTDLENWLSYAPPFGEEETYGVTPVSAEPFSAITGSTYTPNAGPKSIVAQIDDILQEKMAGTALEMRDIHIKEMPNGGVVVWVGADHYPGIDAVPDPDIKAMIGAAVKEWETRTG